MEAREPELIGPAHKTLESPMPRTNLHIVRNSLLVSLAAIALVIAIPFVWQAISPSSPIQSPASSLAAGSRSEPHVLMP